MPVRAIILLAASPYSNDTMLAEPLWLSSQLLSDVSRIYADRVARGDRRHRHSGRDALAGAKQGADKSGGHFLPE